MHSFKIHFSSPFGSYINGPTAHVFKILLKVKQSAFTQASFSSLSNIHEYPGGIQIINGPTDASSLDKQTADYHSPHDWLLSLAVDLAALCDMCM